MLALLHREGTSCSYPCRWLRHFSHLRTKAVTACKTGLDQYRTAGLVCWSRTHTRSTCLTAYRPAGRLVSRPSCKYFQWESLTNQSLAYKACYMVHICCRCRLLHASCTASRMTRKYYCHHWYSPASLVGCFVHHKQQQRSEQHHTQPFRYNIITNHSCKAICDNMMEVSSLV